MTFNTRLIKEVTQNFALAFEGSYQYMDLKPKGYQNHNAVNGSFYKLTFAPTLKANDINNFFSRPELRLFATWMDWSSKLDDFASNDAFWQQWFQYWRRVEFWCPNGNLVLIPDSLTDVRLLLK